MDMSTSVVDWYDVCQHTADQISSNEIELGSRKGILKCCAVLCCAVL